MAKKTDSEPYFPFGFRYPAGFSNNEAFPDPQINAVKHRMEFLNDIHKISGIPGHQFAAALALFQKESQWQPDKFWDYVETHFTKKEIVEIATALLPQVQNEPPRLDFPNCTALVDCRFISTFEWESIRRYSIGGSEAAAVLGKSHFQSQRTLYNEKKTYRQIIEDIGKQHILDYGHCVEEYVISAAANKLGAAVYPEYRMFAHKDYPFITCNPDAILCFLDGHLALFEAKTAMWLKQKDWKDGIPDYYEPQPRQYMEVLNDPRLAEGYIGVCLGGLEKDMTLISYVRDAVKGAAQIQEVVAYWNTYIVPGILPPFSGNPKMDMTAQYKYMPVPNTLVETEVTLSDTCIPAFKRYFELQAERKVAENEVKRVKAEADKLLAQIKQIVPEGLTVCSIPGEMAYLIDVKDRTTDTVSMQKLTAKSNLDEVDLLRMAEKIKESSVWDNPQITKYKQITK